MSYIRHKSDESIEDYLENILMIYQRKGRVRSIDIVNDMGFTKASVSIAMKGLREKGYITMDEVGYITLTDEGLALAEKILERHNLLTKWLIDLGVSEEVARIDACRIEHDVSEETFNVLKNSCLNK